MIFDEPTEVKKEPYKPSTKASRPMVSALRKSRPIKQSREGENNPFYGKQHSEETKKRQSEAQKARWDVIRDKLQTEGNSINESLTSIVKREIEKLLKEKGYK